MNLQDFLNKRVKNPVRKKFLFDNGYMSHISPEFKIGLVEFIKINEFDKIPDSERREIKRNYEYLKTHLPPRAEPYLNTAMEEYAETCLKPKLGEYEKILDQEGVQVFLDRENVDQNYVPGSMNHRMVKFGVGMMLSSVRDILPNKKPRIVITDLSKNKHSKSIYKPKTPAMGMQFDRTMFVDWRYIDRPNVFIHEYAHYVADLVSNQTEELLIKAYKDMLDLYFRAAKRKRVDSTQITDKMRNQISKKLGFPVYGLTNHHELFAVLIENWKNFPNNKLTYQFKSLVKNVLTRVQ